MACCASTESLAIGDGAAWAGLRCASPSAWERLFHKDTCCQVPSAVIANVYVPVRIDSFSPVRLPECGSKDSVASFVPDLSFPAAPAAPHPALVRAIFERSPAPVPHARTNPRAYMVLADDFHG